MVLKATNSGSAPLTSFGFQLVNGYTISNVVLTVGGMTSTTDCVPNNGGTRPTVDCTFPSGLIAPGTSFTITLTTTPAYPANQSNFYLANDGTGGGSGTFMGPTPPVAPCPSITLSPPSLPTGSPGQSYMETITASGGAGPYTFKLGGGSLPPGITLGPNGALSGTPTTPGTYNFVVNVIDANGCPGTGNFMITVFQPVTPKPTPCKCAKLTVKFDPTLLNKKGLRPDKHDFGVGIVWRMPCTSGNGGCTAAMLFSPPEVFAGTVPLPKNNFHLALTRLIGFCGGPCGKSTTGHFQIKMRSRGQLNTLFGRTLAYRVATHCGGVTKVVIVRVFINDHGVLRRPPP